MENTISRSRKYGVSSKHNFGEWNHVVCGPFKTEEQAQEWLRREEFDFRERELMSRSAAVRLAGKKKVENAVSPEDCIEWQPA